MKGKIIKVEIEYVKYKKRVWWILGKTEKRSKNLFQEKLFNKEGIIQGRKYIKYTLYR